MGQETDLMLGPGVGAHKCVLSILSPFLTDLLSTMDSSEVVTVVLPQVELVIVEKMLQLVYTGR